MSSGICIKCGVWRETIHKDHIIPKCLKIDKGEDPDKDNIQLLCANCHEEKTAVDKESPEYIAYFRKKYWDDPEWIKAVRISAIAFNNTEEAKLACGERAKERWSNPEFKSSVTQAVAIAKANWTLEEYESWKHSISKAKSGQKRSPEQIEASIAPQRGRKHPPDCNHCKSLRGRPKRCSLCKEIGHSSKNCQSSLGIT